MSGNEQRHTSPSEYTSNKDITIHKQRQSTGRECSTGNLTATTGQKAEFCYDHTISLFTRTDKSKKKVKALQGRYLQKELAPVNRKSHNRTTFLYPKILIEVTVSHKRQSDNWEDGICIKLTGQQEPEEMARMATANQELRQRNRCILQERRNGEMGYRRSAERENKG